MQQKNYMKILPLILMVYTSRTMTQTRKEKCSHSSLSRQADRTPASSCKRVRSCCIPKCGNANLHDYSESCYHHCISLKAILQGTARVPATSKEIPNPWGKQSLCGIAYIMHDRFRKRFFVTFNNHLLDAMGIHLSEAETKSFPLKAVAEVQKMMCTWETHNLWAQMSLSTSLRTDSNQLCPRYSKIFVIH
jgi:hypothetical protein